MVGTSLFFNFDGLRRWRVNLFGQHREGFDTRTPDLRRNCLDVFWSGETLNSTNVRDPSEQKATKQDGGGNDCGQKIVRHWCAPVLLCGVAFILVLSPGPFQKKENLLPACTYLLRNSSATARSAEELMRSSDWREGVSARAVPATRKLQREVEDIFMIEAYRARSMQA